MFSRDTYIPNMEFADRKTLTRWSQGLLIAAFLSALIAVIGRIYPILGLAVIFLVLSFFIFSLARKKPEVK